MENVKPLHSYVLVKCKVQEEKTSSGLVVQSSKKEHDRGVVMAHGDGKTLSNGSKQEMTVQAGDEVIFAKNIIREEKVDGIKDSVYLWMELDNIIGKI